MDSAERFCGSCPCGTSCQGPRTLEAFFVAVAVLHDDGRDLLRMAQRELVANGDAVVNDVNSLQVLDIRFAFRGGWSGSRRCSQSLHDQVCR